MLTKTDLETIRGNLEDERSRLLQQITDSDDVDSRSFSRNPDRSQLASEYFSRARQSALKDVEQDRLHQIESALQRLEDGVYGKCQNCGQSINPERLKALPYAALCIDCREKKAA